MEPTTLLTIGGMALLDMLSPATIGVSLVVLLSGARRVGWPLFVYLATVAGFYFCVGVALMLGFGAAVDHLAGLARTTPAQWALLVLGVGMLATALLMPTKRTRPHRAPTSFHPAAMVALGLSTGVAEVGMALPYLGAIGIMTTAGLTVTQWLPLLAGYNLVMVLPPVLLYAGYRLAAPWLRPRMERWRDKIANAGREAFAWILGIAGFLVARHAGVAVLGCSIGGVVTLC